MSLVYKLITLQFFLENVHIFFAFSVSAAHYAFVNHLMYLIFNTINFDDQLMHFFYTQSLKTNKISNLD